MTTTHTWDNYPLRSGTVTDLGTVEAVSLTAYLIGGQWVPFQKVHGPKPPIEPMVVIL